MSATMSITGEWTNGQFDAEGNERILRREASDGQAAQYFTTKQEQKAFIAAQLAAAKTEDAETMIARMEALLAIAAKPGRLWHTPELIADRAMYEIAAGRLQEYAERLTLTAAQTARVWPTR